MAPLAEVARIAGPDLPPPTRLGSADLDHLRAENERLRTQLSAAERIAAERQGRIEDLTAALQGLPQAWMNYLEREAEARQDREPDPAPDAPAATVIEVLASRPGGNEVPPPPPADQEASSRPPDLAAAEAAWREVRKLRDRLERERLDRELERIRSRGGRPRRQAFPRAS